MNHNFNNKYFVDDYTYTHTHTHTLTDTFIFKIKKIKKTE